MTKNSVTFLTVFFGVSVFLPPVAAVEPVVTFDAVTLDALMASSDVVMSEAAVEGVPVELVARPSEILGGIGKPLTPGKPSAAGPPAVPPGQGGTPPRRGVQPPPPPPPPPPVYGIVNGEFTTDASGWTAVNAYGGASSYGSIVPDAGSVDGRFAVAHTGPAGLSGQGSLTQAFNVGTPASQTFSVLYNFISTEWTGTSGSQFNDRATVTLSNGSGTAMFSLIRSVDNSSALLFPVTGLPVEINAGLGQSGGQTGWLVGSSAALYFSAGSYSIRIDVMDAGDAYVDSAILVDRVGLQ